MAFGKLTHYRERRYVDNLLAESYDDELLIERNVNRHALEGTMIVVANRVPVTKGYEGEFEKRFDHRLSVVERMPGFIRNEILRPILGDYYILMTHWESRETFEAWTQSEEFKRVHSNLAPKEMCPGPNGFEMHEVILVSEKKS